MNFNGQLLNDQAVLDWSTSSEVNSSRFEVLRSYDGINFSIIGSVPAIGNSSMVQYYKYIDIVVSSTNYYRLKMVDRDGKYQLSNVVTIRKGQVSQRIAIVNPFHNKIELKLAKDPEGRVEVNLFDLSGKLVGREEFANTAQVTLTFNNKLTLLSKGTICWKYAQERKSLK